MCIRFNTLILSTCNDKISIAQWFHSFSQADSGNCVKGCTAAAIELRSKEEKKGAHLWLGSARGFRLSIVATAILWFDSSIAEVVNNLCDAARTSSVGYGLYFSNLTFLSFGEHQFTSNRKNKYEIIIIFEMVN